MLLEEMRRVLKIVAGCEAAMKGTRELSADQALELAETLRPTCDAENRSLFEEVVKEPDWYKRKFEVPRVAKRLDCWGLEKRTLDQPESN